MRRLRCARGSVSVELAAVLPLVGVCMLMVAQVGLLVAEALAVHHAAREGARAAAVGASDEETARVAIDAARLDPARASVRVEPSAREVGDVVSVEVLYRGAVFPMISRFVPDASLAGRVAMRVERAPDG